MPPPTKAEVRLKFASLNDFKNALNAITLGDKEKLNRVLQLADVPSGFKSLNKNINILSFNTVPRSVVSSNEVDRLVPDPYFSSLLNNNREIEVENKVYKITKYGTFEIAPEKYNRAVAIIDSLQSSGASLTPTNRMLSFETTTEVADFFKSEDGIFRFDTYKHIDLDELEDFSDTFNNVQSLSITSTNPYNIPQSDINVVSYTNDKIFKNFTSKHRIRANIHDYNWLINTLMNVELTSQIKGWTGGWRGFTNIEELAIHLNALTVKRNLVAGPGADGYPASGIYYFPQWVPVGTTPPPAGAKGTVTVVENQTLTFNLYPETLHAFGGPSIQMNFIPLINAAAGGTVDVLNIDLGCYGKHEGSWVGIEYK